MHDRRAALMMLTLMGVLPGCGSFVRWIGHPTVARVKPRVVGMDVESIALAFDIHIRNPYFFGLKTPRCRYHVDIAGMEFTRGELTTRMRLPGRRVTVLSVPARLKYSNLLRTYRALADADKAAYALHGTLLFSVLTRPVTIPIRHNGTFPILHVPRIRNVSVSFSEVSLEKAHVRVDAEIENTNGFEIDVHDAGFELRLGVHPVAKLQVSTNGTLPPGQCGHITLTGEVRAGVPLARLLDGQGAGKPTLIPSGFIKTPHGTVRLQKPPPQRTKEKR